MTASSKLVQIQHLRHQQLLQTVESISHLVFAFFSVVFLPQLLVRYFYSSQPLLEEPALLKAIPVVAFVLGAASFIYMVVINISRSRKISALMADMPMGAASDDQLDDLEALASKLVKTAGKKKRTTRKSTKK